MTDVSQLFRALAAAPTWVATQPQTQGCRSYPHSIA